MNLRQMAIEAHGVEEQSILSNTTAAYQTDFNRMKNMLAKMGVSRDRHGYAYDIVNGQAILRLDGLAFRIRRSAYADGMEMLVEDWPEGAAWEWVSSLQDIGCIIERGPVVHEPAQEYVPADERIADALEKICNIMLTADH